MATKYVYPYSVKTALPTLSQIIDSLARADAKSTEYRDIRPLMAIEKRLFKAVSRFEGYRKRRRTALRSTSWTIQAIDPAYETEVEFIEARLKDAIKFIVNNYHDTVEFGKLALGLKWDIETWDNEDQTREAWAPIEFKYYEPEDCEFNEDYPGGVAQLLHESGLMLRKAFQESILESYILAYDGNPLHGGLLRTLLIPGWLWSQDLQDWRNFNRRLKGLVVANYGGMQAADADAQEAAEEAVRTLGDTNWAAVPESIKFEFLKMVDATANSSYQDFKKQMQEDFEVAWLGTAGTTGLDNPYGSRAAVEALIHQVGQTIAYEDRQNCKDVINEQLIRQDYMRNFAGESDRHVLPYEFVWKVEKVQDNERNARVALSMLRDMKVPLYRTELEEKCGFTIASEDEIIQPNTQVFTGMEI